MSENLHDKGYKRIFSKRENFLDLLKSFVNEKWVQNIQEENIQLIDKEFISNDFKEKEADIIYKCNCGNETVIFYVLLELQSTVDNTMPFRLLNYMSELLKREFLNTPEDVREKSDYRLPAVLPVIIHNGVNRWKVVQSFGEYQQGYELFKEHIIDFKYILLNVNSYSDDELLEVNNLVSLIFAFDKKSDRERLIRLINRSVKIFANLTSDAQIDFTDWLKDVFFKKYAGDKSNVLEFIQFFSKGEGEKMTYAIERMFDEERERGIEKGIERGIEKGIEKGKEEILRSIVGNMIKNGKSDREISKDIGLSISQVNAVKQALGL